MKAVVAPFNQEKALVGAFSVITNLRMELFEALATAHVIYDNIPPSPAVAPAAAHTFLIQNCPKFEAVPFLSPVTRLRPPPILS